VSERYVDLSICIVNYYILCASRLWCSVEGSYSICSAGEEILKFQLSAGFFTGLKCAEILHSAAEIVKRNQAMLYLGRSLSNKRSLSLHYIFLVPPPRHILCSRCIQWTRTTSYKAGGLIFCKLELSLIFRFHLVVTVFCHQEAFFLVSL
jgi:hypothetical protein